MTLSQGLKILNNSKRTVFRLKDLTLLWNENILNTKMSAKRMVERKLLFKPSKGYYALNKDYDIYELANLIISPSYVSFNSALFFHNVCFQIRDTIDSVALFNHRKKIEKTNFQYFVMKKKLFFEIEGIIFRNNISIACPERAILDCFYFGFLPNIDNEEKINLDYLKKLSLLYPKSIQGKIKKIYAKN